MKLPNLPLLFALLGLLLCATCGKKNDIPLFGILSPSSDINVESICYSRDIAPMIMVHCAPCHPSINGVDLSGYANAKSHLDRMIIRTEAGTMPGSGPKLTVSQIDTLKAWRINNEKQCY
jgi:hypothetical protein